MAHGLPTLPLAFRLVNRAGGGLRALGLAVGRLDADAMLAAARRRTGLADVGAGPFLEGYPRLVQSLEHEADLTPMGRVMARGEFARVLENRLRLVDAWRRHPTIGDRDVVAPIVIVGLPRTGTSRPRRARPTPASPTPNAISRASIARCPSSRRCTRWARGSPRSAWC
jgi:hypothetical protein